MRTQEQIRLQMLTLTTHSVKPGAPTPDRSVSIPLSPSCRTHPYVDVYAWRRGSAAHVSVIKWLLANRKRRSRVLPQPKKIKQGRGLNDPRLATVGTLDLVLERGSTPRQPAESQTTTSSVALGHAPFFLTNPDRP